MPKLGRPKTKGPLRNFKLRSEIGQFLDAEAGDTRKIGKPSRTGLSATLYIEKTLEYFRRLKPEVRDNLLGSIFHRQSEVKPPTGKSKIKVRLTLMALLVSMLFAGNAPAAPAMNRKSISLEFVYGVGDTLGLQLSGDPKNSCGPLPNAPMGAPYRHHLLGGRTESAANRFQVVIDDQAKALSRTYHPVEIISAQVYLMPGCGSGHYWRHESAKRIRSRRLMSAAFA